MYHTVFLVIVAFVKAKINYSYDHEDENRNLSLQLWMHDIMHIK